MKVDAQIEEKCRRTISYLQGYSCPKLYISFKKLSNQKRSANIFRNIRRTTLCWMRGKIEELLFIKVNVMGFGPTKREKNLHVMGFGPTKREKNLQRMIIIRYSTSSSRWLGSAVETAFICRWIPFSVNKRNHCVQEPILRMKTGVNNTVNK